MYSPSIPIENFPERKIENNCIEEKDNPLYRMKDEVSEGQKKRGRLFLIKKFTKKDNKYSINGKRGNPEQGQIMNSKNIHFKV